MENPPKPTYMSDPNRLLRTQFPGAIRKRSISAPASPPGGLHLKLIRDNPSELEHGRAGVDGAPDTEPPPWKLNRKIGSGTWGTVYLEKVLTSGMESPELWAVKRVSRAVPNFPVKRYKDEIKNLQALSGHEWFVKFKSSYKDEHYMYIAMEYLPMGDMSKTFMNGYRWSESDTKVVIEQLLHGLAVMHKEGITHRDLKPENVFLYLPENRARVLHVKIGDFGTSKRFLSSSTSTCLRTTAGTQAYMAPEAGDESVSKTNKVDIWSLGCILYRMFAGRLLFMDLNAVVRYSLRASSPPPAVENIGLSVPCVDFLCDVLQPGPVDRPSAEDCLKKPWILNRPSSSGYSIGKGLYSRLSKIKPAVSDIDTSPHIVATRAADSTSDTKPEVC